MKKKSKPSFWFENALENAFHNIKVDPLGLKDPQKWLSAKSIAIKISKKDDEFILHAELPGFSKDEVKVKITPNYVDISAEKKKTSIEKKKGFYREESGFSSVRR